MRLILSGFLATVSLGLDHSQHRGRHVNGGRRGSLLGLASSSVSLGQSHLQHHIDHLYKFGVWFRPGGRDLRIHWYDERPDVSLTKDLCLQMPINSPRALFMDVS